MNFWKKLILAWKGREILGTVTQAARGWKTPAFWVTLLGSCVTYMATLKEYLPPEYGLIITSVLVALYNVLRGVEKGEMSGVRPWYKTTEFWLGLAAQAQNAVLAIQTGGVSTDTLVKVNGALSAIMVLGNSLATVPPAKPASSGDVKADKSPAAKT